MISKIVDCIYLIFFFAILIAPTYQLLNGNKPILTISERRNPAKMPPLFSIFDDPQFSHKFEAFFNDNFGYRNLLLEKYEELSLNVFKTVPSRFDIQGSENWAYYNPLSFDPNNINYKALYERVEFSESELVSIKQKFLAEKKWLNDHGIGYLIVIVPDKEVVYPEYYPYPNHIISNIGLNQLLIELSREPHLEVVYLKDALIHAKENYTQPLYYRYDTHWNMLGAFVGYQQVMGKVRGIYPEVKPLEFADFQVKSRVVSDTSGDLARLVPSSRKQGEVEISFNLLSEKQYSLMRYGAIDIYGDSYSENKRGDRDAEGLIYFMRFNFQVSRSHYSNIPLDYSSLEKNRPMLVIREVVQRDIHGWATSN